MQKVKITADIMLEIVKSILIAANYEINDPSSPFNGQTSSEALNTTYYTFKHRLHSKSTYLESLSKSLYESYCLVELGTVSRLFSPDIDQVTVDATLTYWLQTDKIKLLEDLIEECNLETVGRKFSVTIGNQARKATIFFGEVVQTDLQVTSAIGESAICQIGISMILAPDITTYEDYSIEIATESGSGASAYEKIPVIQAAFAKSMTQRAVPFIQNARSTGFINLSSAKVFSFTYWGFNTDIVNEIAADIIGDDSDTAMNTDNNKTYLLRITRHVTQKTFTCVMGDSKLQVDNDTGYEIHNLTLVVRGKI